MSRVAELQERVDEWREVLATARARRNLLIEQADRKKVGHRNAKRRLDVWTQEELLLGKVAEQARFQIRDHIEATVTAALQSILETTTLSFRVRFENVASRPSAYWEVVEYGPNGEVLVADSPEDALGGGVVDVVSLALRLSFIELLGVGGPIMADEPGKMVSQQYQTNFAEFFSGFVNETGRQGVLITHAHDMAQFAARSYEVRNESGRSEVDLVV